LDARIFKKEEGIALVEEVGWKLLELHGLVGGKGKSNKVLMAN